MNKLITIVAILTLTGCAASPTKIDISSKTVPIAVPIIYSPAPPVVTRPELPHLTITPEKEKVDGEVVKAYAATVEALIGYAEQLEDIVKQYKEIHDSYNDLASKVATDWKEKTGTDLQVPATPDTTVTVKPPKTVPVPGPGGTTIDCQPGMLCSPAPKTVVPPTTLH